MCDCRYPHAGNVRPGTASQTEGTALQHSHHFITGHGDEKMRLQALRAGALEFPSKPFDDEILLESVRAAMNN